MATAVEASTDLTEQLQPLGPVFLHEKDVFPSMTSGSELVEVAGWLYA